MTDIANEIYIYKTYLKCCSFTLNTSEEQKEFETNIQQLRKALNLQFPELINDIEEASLYKIKSLIDYINTGEQKYYNLFLFKTNTQEHYNAKHLEKFVILNTMDKYTHIYKENVEILKFLLLFYCKDDKDTFYKINKSDIVSVTSCGVGCTVFKIEYNYKEILSIS